MEDNKKVISAKQGIEDQLKRHPERHKKGLRRGMGMIDAKYVKHSVVDGQNALIPQKIKIEGDFKKFKIFHLNGFYLGTQTLNAKKLKETIDEIKATPNALVFLMGNFLHLNECRKRFTKVEGDWYPVEIYDEFLALIADKINFDYNTTPEMILRQSKNYYFASQLEKKNEEELTEIFDSLDKKIKVIEIDVAKTALASDAEKSLFAEFKIKDFKELAESDVDKFDKRKDEIILASKRNLIKKDLDKICELMFEWQGKYFIPEQKALIRILKMIPKEKIGFILRGKQEKYLREKLNLDLMLDSLRKADMDDLYVGDACIPEIKNIDGDIANLYVLNGSAENVISTSSNKKKENTLINRMQDELSNNYPYVDAAFLVGDLATVKKTKSSFSRSKKEYHNQRVYVLPDMTSFRNEATSIEDGNINIPNFSTNKTFDLFWDKETGKPYFNECDFYPLRSKSKKLKSR